MLFKFKLQIQKRVCKADGLSVIVSLEPLGHRQIIASLRFFYSYCFGGCLSQLTQLVSLRHSRGKSTRYAVRLPNFPVTIPRSHKGVFVNSFFP